MESPLIQAKGLSKTYPLPYETVRAVDGADITVSSGEFICIQGESGSGKTTFLNLLAGLESPSGGCLTVCGSDMVRIDDKAKAALRLRKVGVVFQDHNLLEEFTAVENVMLPLEVAGWDRSSAKAAALERLDRVGVMGLASRYPQQLSGGQRQRVGIARALVGHRELLLADEPTGALDSENSMQLFRLLHDMCEDGYSVVLATHEDRGRDFAHRSFRMRDGILRSTA